MSGFTSEALEKKLLDLNNSQQSIQTLSLWLIHHRKHHAAIVQTWFKELKKARQNKKLTFMYLANDVIQNSRKKGPEFTKEFSSVLKAAFENVAKDADDKTWIGLDRILSVWLERTIYDPNQVKEFHKAIGQRKNVKESNKEAKKSENERVKSEMKLKREKDRCKTRNSPELKKRKTVADVVGPANSHANNYNSKNNNNSNNSNNNNNNSAGSKVGTPEKPNVPLNGEMIDPDSLLKSLQLLENSASSDAAVREKIASLPPEVSDATLLDSIRDKGAAEKLSQQVEEACSLLADYNNRLSQELEDRKQISNMLAWYIKNQKDMLAIAEQKLAEYKDKLRRVNQVRNELKSHLQNLPDLSLLPSVTGGLAPLPSAGDLFNIAAARAAASNKLGSTSSASPNTASPIDYETVSTGTPNSGNEDSVYQRL